MLSRSAKQSIRSFSNARVLFSDGGNIGKDAFADKEKAQENVYIKKHEAEQLKALREQLAKQKETIDKLSEEIKDLKK